MFTVILGGGESGVGAAVLAQSLGDEVLLSDAGTLKPQYKAALEAENIPFEEGGHSADKILTADRVVKSPGIPLTAPLVKQLLEKGIPVISEIELAGKYTDSKMLCITGSNGKTTTTLLLHHILSKAGIDAGLGGNVGKSLAWQVARAPKPAYVVELSSFQLDNMYDFRADVAILLNITPDHLDRYDHSMENYGAAKLRITRNQTPTDAFIYWSADPWTLKLLDRAEGRATRYRFDATKGDGLAAWADEESMHIQTPAAKWHMPLTELPLKGRHNLYNAMAAALAATLYGLAPEQVMAGLRSFKPVEHRLEPAGTVDGVEYINDSKATNVDSTFYALQAQTKPVVLILGGLDKGNDYSQIDELVAQKVKAIVCMGVDNAKLENYYGAGKVPRLVSTHSLQEALAQCRAIAQQGDVVLLSPACASFDLFASYEDRGRQFKAAVAAMK